MEEVQRENDLIVERLLELQYLNFMSDLLQGNSEDSIQGSSIDTFPRD
ncbi:hypothetical protein [Metabacillus fastidiosus]